MNDEPEYVYYVHRFDEKTVCTARFPVKAPSREEKVVDFKWNGHMEPEHVNQYRHWILTSLQEVIDRWQTTLLYCLGTDSDWTELWHFQPGRSPRLVKRDKFGIYP